MPHADGQSYVYFRIYEHAIETRLEITVDDLNRALGLAMRTGPGEVPHDTTEADVAAQLDSILTYIAAHFYVGTSAGPLPLDFQGFDLLRLRRYGDFARFTYRTDGLAGIPDELIVEFSALFDVDGGHRNLVHVEHNWKTSTFNNEATPAFILSPSEPRETLDLSSSTTLRGLLGMVRFGISHILTGFDHILFLLALILPAVLYRDEERWKAVPQFRRAAINIVAIVTFFTIAHSITLSLAALQVVSLPSMVVESVIAASIAVAALHNLYPRFIKHESIIAFVFGLFHGFGFASLLEPLGLGREYTALTLFGFNVGVEIGQVAVIALIFPVLYVLRKRPWYTRTVLSYGSVLLIAVALFWFVERAFSPVVLVESKEYVKDIIRPVYYTILGR